MSNPYYTKTGQPASQTQGRSDVIRTEYGLIETGFDSDYAAILLRATSASPTFTGTVTMSGASTVTVPTVAGAVDNSTNAASTAFVQTVLGASGTLLPPQTGFTSLYSLKTNGTTASWTLTLPAQASNSGKYLGSNGTVESWSYPFATGFTAFLPFHANWCGYNFVAVSDSYIYTADGHNVYRYSDDHGATWKSLDGTSLWMYSAPGDGYYYRHTSGNIYRSTSLDGTYSLNGSDGDLTLTRNSFKKIGSNYVSIVNLNPSVPLVSTDGMVSFAACTPSAGTFSSPQNLAVSGSTLYAVAASAGTTRLDKSTDGGVTWT
jgi:hypothetical protein